MDFQSHVLLTQPCFFFFLHMVIHKASTVGKINGMIEGNCFSQCVLSCGCLWPQPNHALHLGSAYQLKKRKKKEKKKNTISHLL